MTLPPLSEFAEKAEAWLDEHAERRGPGGELRWGVGSDNVAVFHNLTLEQERACIDELRAWQRLKSDAGYGSITLAGRVRRRRAARCLRGASSLDSSGCSSPHRTTRRSRSA